MRERARHARVSSDLARRRFIGKSIHAAMARAKGTSAQSRDRFVRFMFQETFGVRFDVRGDELFAWENKSSVAVQFAGEWVEHLFGRIVARGGAESK
jgi:hypothetical protein